MDIPRANRAARVAKKKRRDGAQAPPPAAASSQRGKPHELSAVYGMRQLLDMDREIVYPTPTTFDEELLARWKEERPLSFFDGLGDNDGLGRPGSQNPAAPGGKA